MIKIRSQKIDAAELTKRVETIIDNFEKIDKEVFLQKHTKKDEDFLRATIYLNNTKKQKLFRLIQTILIKSKLTFVEIYAKKIYKKIFPTNKKAFTIEEFIRFEDEKFIKVANKTILGKKIEQTSLNNYLSLLRNGILSKTEILAKMRYSKEGIANSVEILGLYKRNMIFKSFSIPILGKFFKIFLSIAKLPNTITRLQLLESKNYLLEQKLDTKTDELFTKTDELFTKTDELYKNLELSKERIDIQIKELFFKTTTLENNIQNYIDELILTRRFITNTQKDLQNIVSLAKNELKTDSKTTKDEIITLENRQLESFYIAFENRFRGSRADIKQRQEYYLPYIKEVVSSPLEEVLDVGCGRGEWLELLKENGIKAKGVDLNSLMIEESNSLGLDTKVQDAIAYLKALEDETLSAISGFHIVEHLPFDILVQLFDESLRVLKKGGMIIFETPNPENIFVGACSFYTDPTHINPIPPSTLQFLAQNRGFKDVDIHRLHPVKQPIYPDIEKADDINTLIFASTKEQDYSIIGYK